MASILIVDDDESIVRAFERFLADDGHEARIAGSAAEGLARCEERRPDLIIMDIRMPGGDGLEALQQMRHRFPGVSVVMMTAYGTSQTSIDAIRWGAFEYLTKPLDLDELRTVINRALEAGRVAGPSEPRDHPRPAPPVSLVGRTPVMQEVYKLIARLATTDVPALIWGEPGTGRHLVARTIHENSPRHERPFVRLDCAMLSGAVDSPVFPETGGTVLLADVEALPPDLQSALARRFRSEAVGRGTGRDSVPDRILAATARDLVEDARRGAFNRELVEALSVITIRLPPLRERRDDIPLLVQHLVERLDAELNRPFRGVDGRVAARLQDADWPGNVRELERVVKRAGILARSDAITLEDIEESLAQERAGGPRDSEAALRAATVAVLRERLVNTPAASGASPYHDVVELVEEEIVRAALAITGGNQLKAAELLRVNRATLRKKRPEP